MGILYLAGLLVLAAGVSLPFIIYSLVRQGSRLGEINQRLLDHSVRLAAVERSAPAPDGGEPRQPSTGSPPISHDAAAEPPATRDAMADEGAEDGSSIEEAGVDPRSVPPPYVRPPSGPPVTERGMGQERVGPALPRESLEQRIGTRWAVYIGGLALAFGGVFLVKSAIDAGLLTPATRVVLGFLLGLAMAGGGTRMALQENRGNAGPVVTSDATPDREGVPPEIASRGRQITGGLPSAHIPSVLTAAGTLVLFASAYAAYALYGLIGPGVAFLLLGAIGIATMLSAAIHGPVLAGLGLAGSYVTPLLVSTDAPSPWALLVYLLVVSLSALLLARIRGWVWLVRVAVAGAMLWTIPFLMQARGAASPWNAAAMLHVVVQSVLAAYLIAIEPNNGRDDEAALPDPIAALVLGPMALLAVLTLAVVPFANAFWLGFVAVMISLFVAAAYLAPAAGVAGVLAAVIAAAAMVVWPGLDDPPSASELLPGVPNLIRFPETITTFATFALLSSAAIAAPAMHTLLRRRALPATTVAIIAGAAALAPLAALIIAYLRITGFGTAISFSAIGIGLAFAFVYAADVFQRREGVDPLPAVRLPTAVFAAAAIAALSVALVAGLQRGYLTVAFALAAWGVAYVASRKDIALLRYGAGALGLAVLGRIVWNPLIMGDSAGAWPILNWVLFGYGIPALAFWRAAELMRGDRADWPGRLMDGLAVLFTALLVFFELRLWLHEGNILAASSGHAEMGLMVLLALLLSHVLMRMAVPRRSEVLDLASLGLALLGGLSSAIGLGIIHNPYLSGELVVGASVISSLLPAYLLPGLAALYVARHAHGQRPWPFALVAAVFALGLVFAYVTLEVRHVFQGERIAYSLRTSNAEAYAYTAAWLVLAIVFLGYGLVRGSVPARAASGVLLACTVVKVGLFDLAGVSGVWRALSFICLGGVLMGIGLVYQRYVFAPGRQMG